MTLQRHWRLILPGAGALLLISALGWGLHNTLDKTWINTTIRGHGLSGELLFVITAALAVAAGMSRQFISFLSSYAFGLGFGFALALAASIAGCTLSFYLARWLGRHWVIQRYGQKLKPIDDFLRGHPFTMTLIIRLFPVGSNLMVNLAAGVSAIPFWPFLFGSALGYIPQTAVFALIGSGITVNSSLRIGLGLGLFLMSGLLGLSLYLRYQMNKNQPFSR
ncbi:MAG: hypothetical protein AXA67_06760 [Methylothermaceae bacteria B42]|nr:MAG: hypothetical protein AXA67_06760 [Methylothermaceae bacteria B42]HHJ40274.1 DedA family protein [Methylothermaceae bacterium]